MNPFGRVAGGGMDGRFPGALFGGMGLGMGGGGRFSQRYRCFTMSFFCAQHQRDQTSLDRGDKIILPPSALEQLAHLAVSYPMMFELTGSGGKKVHCGVLEFGAEEGQANLPYWVMQNLNLEEGSLLEVSSANIPKGKFVKFRPQKSDFLDISNPKAVLENSLRNFSALTSGETIRIHYNNRTYDIDVVEIDGDWTSEHTSREAISIIETDLNVDFAPPADYKEPTPVAPAPIASPHMSPAIAPSAASPKVDPETQSPSFKAFHGSGFRLDGKPSPHSSPSASSISSPAATAHAPAKPAVAPIVPPSNSLVFGAAAPVQPIIQPGVHRPPAAPAAAAAAASSSSSSTTPSSQASKFQPFAGKGHSLR